MDSMDSSNVVDSAYGLFIDGVWVEAEDGKASDVYSPANGKLLATCAEASRADVECAVAAATVALQSWQTVKPAERAAMLLEIADLIEAEAAHLEMVETLDVGRSLGNSKFMVAEAADHFRYFAGAIRTEEGAAQELDASTLRVTLSEPVGVVGQIVPWNAPIMIAAWKIAPALAAANTLVMKPSSVAPLGVVELFKLLAQVLPAGVVNLVTGAGSTTGSYLLDHPGVQKLSFTGSSEVGLAVADAAAKKLVPATLELGGKSANIVFPDADLDRAVTGTLIGILVNSGQVCCAGSRVFVHEDIYDSFLADCVAAFESMKVGLPWEEDTFMGSMIDENQMKKVLDYVDIGKKEGARVACGGYRITENGLDKGFYIAPTILADVDNRMRVAQEEIFGPVAVFIKFKNEAEAISMANESDYGLGGGVWTKDIDRAFRVARQVKTGTMWVNTFLETPTGSPFGGYKRSGYGREVHKMVLDHYTQTKNILIRLET